MNRIQKQPVAEPSASRLAYAALADAFPEVDPGLIPFADRVLVQMRSPKNQTAGGILIPEEAQETEMWNTQVAKVIAVGPTSFKNQDTLEPWKEGDWCKVGDFIRVPKHGGDRWRVPVPGTTDYAVFVVFKDLDLIGHVTVDPLSVVAYLY